MSPAAKKKDDDSLTVGVEGELKVTPKEPEPEPEPPKDEPETKDETPEGAPKLESPEEPAAPPKAEAKVGGKLKITDTQTTGPSPRALEKDTGIATALGTRPSAFSPPGTTGTLTAPLDAADYGQNSQMASRPNTFDEDPVLAGTQSPSPGQ